MQFKHAVAIFLCLVATLFVIPGFFAARRGWSCALRGKNFDLFLATKHGCSKLTKNLLSIGNLPSDEEAIELLRNACEAMSPSTVSALLSSRTAEFFSTPDDFGDLPLHVCAKSGCASCCKRLLSAPEVDRFAKNANGELAEEVASNVQTYDAIAC